jgi:hypothetical protein
MVQKQDPEEGTLPNSSPSIFKFDLVHPTATTFLVGHGHGTVPVHAVAMSSNTNGLDNYAATLQERKRKEKEAKQKELQKMQEARLGGKSALDCMEDDDDGNVYDLVDDEEYAKIVKSRREESDFVVDDNGIGYADDGEEVVGVIEDAYDGE